MYLWVVAVSDAILFNDYNDKLIFKFLLLANLSFFVFYKIINVYDVIGYLFLSRCLLFDFCIVIIVVRIFPKYFPISCLF